jgi:hypothetical protein
LEKKRPYDDAFQPIEVSDSETDVESLQGKTRDNDKPQVSSIIGPRRRNVAKKNEKTLVEVMTKAFAQDIKDETKGELHDIDDVSIFTEHIGRQLRAVKNRKQYVIMQNSIQNAIFKCQLDFCQEPDVSPHVEVTKKDIPMSTYVRHKGTGQKEQVANIETSKDQSSKRQTGDKHMSDSLYETGSDDVIESSQKGPHLDPEGTVPKYVASDKQSSSKSSNQPCADKSGGTSKKTNKKSLIKRTTRMTLRQKVGSQLDDLNNCKEPTDAPEDI